MGNMEVKRRYKTKSILGIFVWQAKVNGFNLMTCEEINSLNKELTDEYIEKDRYEVKVKIPFELLEKDRKVAVNELIIALLLVSKDEQGNRIDLFKALTTDPEKLFNYFRFKYYLIYKRIPEYLMDRKLLDPVEGKEFVERKSDKIMTASNEKYLKYTTSSCNVLKITLLKP